tara:strand:- start:276 stop:497 length:222 start_codon:yes stop_codon:yes gene_type:complete
MTQVMNKVVRLMVKNIRRHIWVEEQRFIFSFKAQKIAAHVKATHKINKAFKLSATQKSPLIKLVFKARIMASN